jgi:asparagine synthase (glutamine-hydrolysing)
MCGIVALMDYGGAAVDSLELLRIRDAMAARGPDGAGLWISPDRRVGLAHRRLSLLDLSEAGAQPMANGDGSLRIVFNGEIYNYRELRQELEKKGFVFRSGSDTEVLLHLYAHKGEAMLDELRGMYAFVIWDERRRCLFATRDPFGIKPLYIADDGRCIRIASQVKALLAGGRVDTTRDPAGQVGFLLWGYVPEPFTLYRSIASFPAGACMTISADGSRFTRYFCRISEEIARLEQDAPARPGGSDLQCEVRAALSDSVRHHLVADVPVAVFLSAGLDSASVTALAAEQAEGGLRSVTLGFTEYRGTGQDETAAGMVAQRYRTDHHTRWFCRDDFEAEMHSIVSAMDQPSTDGINTYFVSKAARACGVKTALSGLGGDELFGTYPSFRDVPRMVRLFGGNPFAAAGSAVRRLASPLLGRIASAKYAGLLEYGGTFAGAYLLRRGLFMPWEMSRILPRETVREGWERLAPLQRLADTVAPIRSIRLKISALEMTWYMRNQLLRDSDWAGMAHSVEIRVPMVDIGVLRALAPVLANRPMEGKRVLGEVPARPLPEALLERPKTGFAVPVHEWVSPPQPGAPPRTLSMGLRNWALRLAREFDLAGCGKTGFETGVVGQC